MTFSQNDRSIAIARPLWMPHPALLAFIAVLWTLAYAAQALS